MPPPPQPNLLTYLTTDPQALGILSWASTIITVLGFVIAIWQIARVKRSAEAARLAAIGMELRVRSRELLAKLGEAHTHLEAARDHLARGERQITILCLDLAGRYVIEAQEIAKRLSEPDHQDLQLLGVLLADLAEQITDAGEPLPDQPEFVQLRLQIREVSGLLQRNMAQSRYTYDFREE